MSDELIAELRRDEGVRRKPYLDTVSKITIGVGRNLTDVGLSDDEIEYLLRNDIARAEADLDRNVAWWRELDEVRSRALVNLCFNLGWPRLSGFRKALSAIKAEDWQRASAELLNSKWASQVGARAKRIAQMIRTGVAP